MKNLKGLKELLITRRFATNAVIWIAALVLFVGISILTFKLVVPFRFPFEFILAVLVGFVAWGFFLAWSVEKTLMNVPPQEVWHTSDMISGDIVAWKGPKLYFIYAWETPVKEYEVKLTEPINVTGDQESTYLSSDRIPLKAAWTQLILPDPDKTLVFIKYKRADIAAQFKATTNQKLSDLCGKKKADEITGHKDEISKEVADFYGGESTTCPIEDKYAVKTKDPILDDIDQDPDVLKAKQIKTEFEVVRETAEDLVATAENRGDKLNMSEAMRLLLLYQRVPGVQDRQYSVDIKGLPTELRHIALGGHIPLMGGSQGQQGGQGGNWRKNRNKKRGSQGQQPHNP